MFKFLHLLSQILACRDVGSSIKHKRYVGHVPICLLFLSLWLWGGNLQGQNLDCGNPILLSECQIFSGDTDQGSRNASVYEYPNGISGGAVGPEVVHAFTWANPQLSLDISAASPATVFLLLSSCENGSNGFPVVRAELNVGSNLITISDIPGVSNSTFYIVAEGPNFDTPSEYDITLFDPANPCQEDDPCENPIPLTIGTEYQGSNVDGTSTFVDYANGATLDGPEIVHTIDWPGGVMKVTFSNGDLILGGRLFLNVLNSCDPNDFRNGSYEMGSTNDDEVGDLPVGTYYLVVDGFTTSNNVDFYKLLVEREDPPQDPCENPITLTEGNLYTGSNQNGTTTFNQYTGLQFGNDGPEVVHVIDWPGGEMQATLSPWKS
ncbi:MAG: hypothetical protein AAGC85_22740 [Bacteroidota bacterium]